MQSDQSLLSTKTSLLITEVERSVKDLALLSKGVNALKESEAATRAEVAAAAQKALAVDAVSSKLDLVQDRVDSNRCTALLHSRALYIC